jgi:hypothetical protein
VSDDVEKKFLMGMIMVDHNTISVMYVKIKQVLQITTLEYLI